MVEFGDEAHFPAKFHGGREKGGIVGRGVFRGGSGREQAFYRGDFPHGREGVGYAV